MNANYKSDGRVLGDSDFVETLLRAASEAMERKYRLRADRHTFDSIVEQVGKIFVTSQ